MVSFKCIDTFRSFSTLDTRHTILSLKILKWSFFMKTKNLFSLSFLCSLLLLLSGCASYQARPLRSLIGSTNSQSKEQTVSFDYHIFSKSDCKRYLDRDAIGKGYQPIQISLTNNTNRYLRLTIDSFSIPIICPEEVAEKMHTSTMQRAASYGVGAVFLFPLIIPAVVDGIGSYQANQELDADFDQKAISNKIINPHSSINGLIFAPVEGFNPIFNFSVFDNETNERFVLSTSNQKLKI